MRSVSPNFHAWIKCLTDSNNLEHYQAFDATTYTLISRFDKKFNNAIEYETFDGHSHSHGFLDYNDISINDSFFLSDKEQLQILKEVRLSLHNTYVSVKNGFATLADKVFIGEFDFQHYTIDILKASTGKWLKCVFPYNSKGQPLSEDEIKDSEAFKYLESHKEELSKGRDLEKGSQWFLFGRTQALKDVCRNKIAINTIIKDLGSIKLSIVPSGKGVYSGLYILTDLDFDMIQSIIKSNDFLQYIKSLKNYKSGGYYTFSSKDLEMFLNHKIHIING